MFYSEDYFRGGALCGKKLKKLYLDVVINVILLY